MRNNLFFCLFAIMLTSCITNNNELDIRNTIFSNNTDAVYYNYKDYNSISSEKKDIFFNDEFDDNRNNWYFPYSDIYDEINDAFEIEGWFFINDEDAYMKNKISIDTTKNFEIEFENFVPLLESFDMGLLIITPTETMYFYEKSLNNSWNSGSIGILKNKKEIFTSAEVTLPSLKIRNSTYYSGKLTIRKVKPWFFYYFNEELMYAEKDNKSILNIGLSASRGFCDNLKMSYLVK